MALARPGGMAEPSFVPAGFGSAWHKTLKCWAILGMALGKQADKHDQQCGPGTSLRACRSLQAGTIANPRVRAGLPALPVLPLWLAKDLLPHQRWRRSVRVWECGDKSPLSHWETCLPVPKRGRVRALHSGSRRHPGASLRARRSLPEDCNGGPGDERPSISDFARPFRQNTITPAQSKSYSAANNGTPSSCLPAGHQLDRFDQLRRPLVGTDDQPGEIRPSGPVVSAAGLFRSGAAGRFDGAGKPENSAPFFTFGGGAGCLSGIA